MRHPGGINKRPHSVRDITRLLRPALIAAFFIATPLAVHAQDKVVATVNGKSLTEKDMKLAETEIGDDLGSLPPATRRRVLIEYLIENQLFAEAAEGEKLGQRDSFDERMQYWRRRALRDTYFDITVKEGITEAEKKAFYESQVTGRNDGEQVRARHILVDSEEKAKEIHDKITKGGDFKQLASEFSKDPGSKQDGGDLGYFGKGQMVPVFEDTAFKLKVGEVSQPVKSQFGWHLIKLEDRREVKPPPYENVKDRITAALMHKKAQEMATSLRKKATIDYVDPELKKQVEAQKAGANGAKGAAPPAPAGK
jgi:peptidyl-prolyl cis-trans isomerase C